MRVQLHCMHWPARAAMVATVAPQAEEREKAQSRPGGRCAGERRWTPRSPWTPSCAYQPRRHAGAGSAGIARARGASAAAGVAGVVSAPWAGALPLRLVSGLFAMICARAPRCPGSCCCMKLLHTWHCICPGACLSESGVPYQARPGALAYFHHYTGNHNQWRMCIFPGLGKLLRLLCALARPGA